MRTPVALGETYRTRFELAPFFEAKAMGIVQPEVGRCGITESLRIARAAERAGVRVAPHLAPSVGPLLYATLQFAAAVPNCDLAPYAPSLVEIANTYSAQPLAFREGRYVAPCAPGLGIDLDEPELRRLQVG
jgi:galactonate dehydratase